MKFLAVQYSKLFAYFIHLNIFLFSNTCEIYVLPSNVSHSHKVNLNKLHETKIYKNDFQSLFLNEPHSLLGYGMSHHWKHINDQYSRTLDTLFW
jgi:hypothetical protein